MAVPLIKAAIILHEKV